VTAMELTYLSGEDIDGLALTDAAILAAVERGLIAQGRGEAVLEPRTHLFPGGSARGHFNVLRGALPAQGAAGVKVVGDFVDNHRLGLPSELALLLLLDPATGAPRAILDATAITAMRTGAVTALGARHLARPGSRVLGHVGARGTAYWNVRLLAGLFELDEIRVHSRRRESRQAFAAQLTRDLGREVVAVDSWERCVRGADIVVEATRLAEPRPLLRTEWIRRGALVIPYGTVSAVELSLLDAADKVVVDDWGQATIGPLGALRRHVDSGRLTRASLHAELGEVVAGRRPGRESEDETIVLWHRGLATSDIALGLAMLDAAERRGAGRRLPYRS
jgi:alanine dehydrogenase